jgi:hypothetical protein
MSVHKNHSIVVSSVDPLCEKALLIYLRLILFLCAKFFPGISIAHSLAIIRNAPVILTGIIKRKHAPVFLIAKVLEDIVLQTKIRLD